MSSVQSLPRGRLKKLLLNKSDHVCKPESGNILNSNAESSVKLEVANPSFSDGKSIVPTMSRSSDYTMAEQGGSSDSDASSVEDHLVDPKTLNLNESFFSPTYQNQQMVDSTLVDQEEEHRHELSDADSTISEEDDKMFQIYSQITDFEKQVHEANACYVSWEKKTTERRCEPIMPPIEIMDVPMMLSQVEDYTHYSEIDPAGEADQNWHSCEVAPAAPEEAKNVEIFVSNTSHKAGRILDVAQSLRRIEQEKRKTLQLEQHKVHLLLLLSHGLQVNRTVNSCIEDSYIELYDLVANSNISIPENESLPLVRSIVNFYRQNVKLATQKSSARIIKIKKEIIKQLVAREVSCRRMYNLMLLTLLRFLCVRSRFVMHLDVVPKSPPAMKPTAKVKISALKATNHPVEERYRNVPLTTTEILKRKPEIRKMFNLSQLDGAEEDSPAEELASKKLRIECPPAKPRLWKLKPAENRKLPHKTTEGILKKPDTIAANFMNCDQPPVKLVSSKYFRKKQPSNQRSAGRKKISIESHEHRREPIVESKPNLSRLIMHKVGSVSADGANRKKYKIPKLDMWIECFLETEQRWTVVEAEIGDTDCMERVIDLIQDPPVYVFAFEADGFVVDVSERYRWRNEQAALKLRVDTKWLKKAIHLHRPPMNDLGCLSDQLEFRQLKFRAPMPTTIGRFKNHPSFCLPRDLHKFQGIYPPDAPPLGYIDGEPIYARECVHTLHSRDVWLRHAKVIRMHELPYKIVKSKLRREQTNLELFGYWQTEDYVPPEPVDGIVPRNAYGNIEIFKECMLPKGTVHLKQYGLSNICRKLRIDYAVAVVGFGIHAGGNHPVFDGIVICEEHKERLLEAWELHQEESAQKRKEKKEKIVLNNWVRLVKGLLVRRKLKNKYNFDGM